MSGEELDADDDLVRPDLLALGKGKLNLIERAQIAFVRRTLEPGTLDYGMRLCQRTVGQAWIHHFTKHLRHVYGLERLPAFDPKKSYVIVANHRSFFDLYVVTSHLVRNGLKHRIVFPVRSSFFYTSPLGLFVNGVMSFFAMYPPIFRERRQAALNVASLRELSWMLARGGVVAGLHPEGMRNKGDDPYSFLPAQRGVGKVLHEVDVEVIPVFVNGLINDLYRQVRSNFDGSGKKIVVVFGEPVELSDLRAQRPSPRVHLAIANRTLEAIGRLGEEEKRHRAELERA
jgi:1-acyl-sn-glycerol-3-phosphate acyltransferase